MKNKVFLSATALLLSLVTVLQCFLACSSETADKKDTEVTTTERTDPPVDPKPEPPAVGTVLETKIKWNFGMVASPDYYTKPNSIVPNENYYSYTDVIEIPFAGTTLTFTDDNTNSGGDANFATYTAYVVSSWKKMNGKWVMDTESVNNFSGMGEPFSEIMKTVSGNAVYTYTTSQDNECIRLCYRSGQTSNYTPEQFPEVTVTYTAQPGTASKKIQTHEWAKSTSSEFYAKELEGLTVNALGDSYFAGNGLDRAYNWLSLLGAKYGMDMNNYGMNASMLSNYTGKGNPMCIRYANMVEKDVDIVIVEGGKNDFNNSTPIGATDSRDIKTFSGALNVIIEGLKEKYPNAMIVCITPWNFSGNKGGLTYKSYADAMMAVAAAQGVYCINASDPSVSGVDMTKGAFKKQYSMKSSDESHLNIEGMKIPFKSFEKLIAEYYKDFKSK